MPKLAKIEKPSIENYETGRKLYCIPLLSIFKGAPQEYEKMFDQYWIQVKEHLSSLEKAGKVSRIYYETISSSGQEALEAINQLNKKSYELIKELMDQGATLEALEDEESFAVYLDWGICLSVIRNKKVADKIIQFYREAEKEREQFIVTKIDETLEEGESAILVMKDENRIKIQNKLPSNIHIFLIHPPTLNDIRRWIRDQMKKINSKPQSENNN
jgi:hypothetical protein